MKKERKSNAKVLLSALFLSVFALNLFFTIQKDPMSGGLSLSSLKSYAQSSGGEGGVTITCSSGDFGQCFHLAYNGSFCECDFTGYMADSCSAWDIVVCNPLVWFK